MGAVIKENIKPLNPKRIEELSSRTVDYKKSKNRMTINEALSWLDTARLVLMNQCRKDVLDSYMEAFGLAISALRAKQEAIINDPLTLNELRQMDGQPVYSNTNKSWYLVCVDDYITLAQPWGGFVYVMEENLERLKLYRHPLVKIEK